MLDELFMRILDLTKAGSIVILAVIAVRFLLKKAPKVISYALWAVVLFRLLCPVTLELPMSVMPEIPSVQENYVFTDIQVSPGEVDKAAYKAIDNRFTALKGAEDQLVPISTPDSVGKTVYVRMKWTDIAMIFGKYIWLLGAAVMVVYSVVTYICLRRRIAVRIPLEAGVFLADDIGFPFVLGIVKPKIYLPSGLNEQERGYILSHERHHIRRMDPLWKALAFLALTLHWFNPLVWVAFILAGKDMEMSCDEAVISKLDTRIRAEYALSLASLSTGKRILGMTPLAFAEGNPKSRIRNLAKWKKPAVWVIVLAVVISVILAVCLLVDPAQTDTKPAATTDSADTSTQQSEAVVDIRPLPPKNPGSSLIEYDPDRQIYITGENVYVDFYVGVTGLPSFNVFVYSKEYIDPESITVEFPVDLPFVVNIDQMSVQRKTEEMVSGGNTYGTMPYYVYYAYRGADMAKLDTNTAIKEDYEALKEEDLPEFYLYTISVAFVNILELDTPVTLEKMDITLGDKTYATKLGRIRVLPKEAFPSEAQQVRRRGGNLGNSVQLYNGGIVKLHDAFTMENAPEDITITGLWMLEEESKILDISAVVTSGGNTIEIKWDGKSPIYLYKGDSIDITLIVKNSLTEKLHNSVHMQVATEYTKDETGETVCDVSTHNGVTERRPYEYYAIIFDGVDMESYYREYYYKNSFRWVEDYRGK